MAGPSAQSQYEEVRAKIAEGLPVKEAIRAVAEARGMKPGAVQTTYYRTNREHRERDGGSGTATAKAPGEAEALTSEELLQQAITALTMLARRAESLEKDAERLRQIQRTLTEIT